MNFWIEHDAEGLVVLAGSGDVPPAPMMGVAVAAVPALCDPRQCLFVDGELIDLGPAPSARHVRDAAARAWVLPGALTELALAQAAKWTQIKAAREAAIGRPLATPYGTFDADPKSRTNITDSIALLTQLDALGTPTEIEFTLADDTSVAVGMVQMVHVGILLGQQVQAAYSAGRALRDQIYDTDATLVTVAAVAWPAEPTASNL